MIIRETFHYAASHSGRHAVIIELSFILLSLNPSGTYIVDTAQSQILYLTTSPPIAHVWVHLTLINITPIGPDHLFDL